MSAEEGFDSPVAVRQVLQQFPAVVPLVVALPPHKVLELIPEPATVQNGFDFIFEVSINFNRVQGRGCLAVDFVACPRTESVNVKHWVNLERRGKFETVGEVARAFENGVGAELTRSQLSACLVDVNVLRVEPDLASDFEGMSGVFVPFVVVLHTLLRALKGCFSLPPNLTEVFETFIKGWYV